MNWNPFLAFSRKHLDDKYIHSNERNNEVIIVIKPLMPRENSSAYDEHDIKIIQQLEDQLAHQP